MVTSRIELRNKVLAARGLRKQKPTRKRERSKLVRNTAEAIFVPDSIKTDKMRYLEVKYGKPIQHLLLAGSLSQVEKNLNHEVDFTTISKWIKKLKLRYTVDNMPKCDGCPRWNTLCQAGYCQLLADSQPELLLKKKEELLGETR